MENRFLIKPELCTACKSCELACAFAHPTPQGALGKARINISIIPQEPAITVNVPVVCLQCDEAACATVCPVDALVWDHDIGALEMHDDRCIRCQMCVPACPFGNIFIDPGTTFPVKCDLCGGDPVCVKFCPTAAISWEPVAVD